MELKVNEVAIPERIDFNYEELKNELESKVGYYTTLVYTDNEIKQAKADKADMNKLKKALNDERIRREKEYMKPFNEFKAQVNEIIGIIDKPIMAIDTQIKEYETKQREDKRAAITEYWKSITRPEWLRLEQLFDEKLLNASVSMKSVKDTVNEKVDKINADVDMLSKLSEFGFEASEVYKTTLDVNKAVAEASRMSEMAKKKAEREAEQARLQAEREAAEQQAATEDEWTAMNPPEETQDNKIVIPIDNEGNINEFLGEAFVVPESGTWVSFKALMTMQDKLDFMEWLNNRHIKYEVTDMEG